MSKLSKADLAEIAEFAHLLRRLTARPHERPAAPSPGGATLILYLGDWHLGDKRTKGTLAALDRLPRLVASLVGIRGITRILACFLGDIVEGEGIYGGQWADMICGARGQVDLATTAAWTLLTGLSTLADTAAIYCPGNHGRTGHGAATASPEANWDLLVYDQLTLLSRETGTVHSERCEGGDVTMASVRGHRLCITHGGGKGKLQLSPQWGTSAGALRWAGHGEIHRARIIACGHYHSPSVGQRNGRIFLINGAAYGGGAARIGRIDPPVQLAQVVTSSNPCESVHFIPMGVK